MNMNQTDYSSLPGHTMDVVHNPAQQPAKKPAFIHSCREKLQWLATKCGEAKTIFHPNTQPSASLGHNFETEQTAKIEDVAQKSGVISPSAPTTMVLQQRLLKIAAGAAFAGTTVLLALGTIWALRRYSPTTPPNPNISNHNASQPDPTIPINDTSLICPVIPQPFNMSDLHCSYIKVVPAPEIETPPIIIVQNKINSFFPQQKPQISNSTQNTPSSLLAEAIDLMNDTKSIRLNLDTVNGSDQNQTCSAETVVSHPETAAPNLPNVSSEPKPSSPEQQNVHTEPQTNAAPTVLSPESSSSGLWIFMPIFGIIAIATYCLNSSRSPNKQAAAGSQGSDPLSSSPPKTDNNGSIVNPSANQTTTPMFTTPPATSTMPPSNTGSADVDAQKTASGGSKKKKRKSLKVLTPSPRREDKIDTTPISTTTPKTLPFTTTMKFPPSSSSSSSSTSTVTSYAALSSDQPPEPLNLDLTKIFETTNPLPAHSQNQSTVADSLDEQTADTSTASLSSSASAPDQTAEIKYFHTHKLAKASYLIEHGAGRWNTFGSSDFNQVRITHRSSDSIRWERVTILPAKVDLENKTYTLEYDHTAHEHLFIAISDNDQLLVSNRVLTTEPEKKREYLSLIKLKTGQGKELLKNPNMFFMKKDGSKSILKIGEDAIHEGKQEEQLIQKIQDQKGLNASDANWAKIERLLKDLYIEAYNYIELSSTYYKEELIFTKADLRFDSCFNNLKKTDVIFQYVQYDSSQHLDSLQVTPSPDIIHIRIIGHHLFILCYDSSFKKYLICKELEKGLGPKLTEALSKNYRLLQIKNNVLTINAKESPFELKFARPASKSNEPTETSTEQTPQTNSSMIDDAKQNENLLMNQRIDCSQM
jgi:hypothetical protein